jgi:LysM repeat protein
MKPFSKFALAVIFLLGLLLNAPVYADSTYTVQAGDSLFRISQQFGVSITAIMQANGLSNTLIYSGQQLIIPDGSNPAPAPATGTQTHTVQPGETLFTIGLRYGLTWTTIAQANGIGEHVYVGQVLTIPSSNNPAPAPTDAPPPTAVPSAPAAGNQTHVVQAGETLYLIGVKYGIPWTSIQQANNLPSETVYAGQQLLIPTAGNVPAPTPAPAPETPTQPGAGTSGTVHVVQLGETLFLIGLKYNLPWTTIAAANGINGQYIYVGQQLTIPPAGTVFQPGTPGKTPPGGSGRRFLVDISEQTLYAFEGDTLVRSMLVSTGTAQYPTVLGTYYIQTRLVSTRMRGCCPQYDLQNVPYTQYFYQGYGIHGTYWHNNFGTPMSHGCVNLTIPDSEWAFNWATYGTQVTIIQ